MIRGIQDNVCAMMFPTAMCNIDVLEMIEMLRDSPQDELLYSHQCGDSG